MLIRLGSLTGRLRLVHRRFRSREPRYLQGRITQLAKTISHILRAEHCRRLARTQVQNIVNGHVSRIRLLLGTITRVREQVGHFRFSMLLCFNANEINGYVAELQTNRRIRELEIDFSLQTRQLAVLANHI